MALKLVFDILGSFITEEGFSIVDGLARTRDGAEFALSNIWIPPGRLGVLPQPAQLTPTWPTTGVKPQISSYAIDTSAWEQQAVRSASDYWIVSRGNGDGKRIAGPHLTENQGLCFWVHSFGVPKTLVRDQYILEFGGGLKLHIHSDGTADLEDARPSAPQPYLAKAQPLAAAGTQILGKPVQILIVPWRRGRILVATDQGGSFEVVSGARLDASAAYASRRTPGESVYYVTTEAAQAFVTASTSCRACWQLTPLTWPDAGLLTSPLIDLPRPITTLPAEQDVFFDTQDSTAAALSLLNADGTGLAPNPSAPVKQIRYQLALTPSGSGAYAPVLYQATARWDRALGTREYTSNDLGSPMKADVTLSRDRAQKSASFTLDNPNDAWTSLKDLYNRVVRLYLDTDDVDGAVQDIFVGYSETAEFIDGRASSIRVPVSGKRKKLKSHIIRGGHVYDKVKDTDAVRTTLLDAGVKPEEMVIYDEGGAPLDAAEPGEDPLWKPLDGTSADEWVQYIADTFSGWVFDDIGGIFYYVPKEYFTAQVLANPDAFPTIYQQHTTDPTTLRPIYDQLGPNPTSLVATRVTQLSEEPRANDIWVIGRDAKTDKPILAHYEDTASISDRTAANYLGERRTFVYATAQITTLDMAQRVCGVFANVLPQPEKRVTIELPDLDLARLPLEGPCTVEGYGVGLVENVQADLSQLRTRPTEYTVRLIS